ncbi:hypothetical protein B296_00046668, partial [Ensete ventricosum]
APLWAPPLCRLAAAKRYPLWAGRGQLSLLATMNKRKVGTRKMSEGDMAKKVVARKVGGSGKASRGTSQGEGSTVGGACARGRGVWSDDASTTAYEQGALCSGIAKQLYNSMFGVLIEKTVKSLIWNQHHQITLIDGVNNISWVISSMEDKIFEFQSQIVKLKAGVTPKAIATGKQWATELEAEVARMKSKLEEAQATPEKARKAIEEYKES